MEVSDRLRRHVAARFAPDGAALVLDVLAGLPEPYYGLQDTERVQSALVLVADGDLARFGRWVEVGRADWRDVLVASGLGNVDWPARLDDALGPG